MYAPLLHRSTQYSTCYKSVLWLTATSASGTWLGAVYIGSPHPGLGLQLYTIPLSIWNGGTASCSLHWWVNVPLKTWWTFSVSVQHSLSFHNAGKLPKGIPTEDEYIARYCQARQIKFPFKNWNFFLALSFFRLAAIAQVSSDIVSCVLCFNMVYPQCTLFINASCLFAWIKFHPPHLPKKGNMQS